MMYKLKRKKTVYLVDANERGFTLIELLVVLGIFVIITTLVLVRNARFNETILLRTLAYEVALSVREAQVYGLSVREAPGGASDFSVGYGVYFDTTDPTRFTLFADLDANGWFNNSNEEVTSFTMTGANEVKTICGYASDSNPTCASYDSAAVVFTRPDPEAAVSANGGGTPLSTVEIHIGTPGRDEERVVVVRSTGQISVE